MKHALENAKRARRLLRWYPRPWRERYGEEFVDHLEQEFEDRPRNLARSINVVRKGVVARLGDVGLSNSVSTPGAQSRAALGTSVALVALTTVVMVDFWARAMGVWSARQYHPIPVSASTGTLTIAVGLVIVVLAAVLLVVVVYAVRQLVRGPARPLAIPSTLGVVSGAFLLYSARYFPRFLFPYIRGVRGIQGMSLSRPGQLVANLSQVVRMTVQRWVDPWNAGVAPLSSMQKVADDCVLLAMFVFGVAIAMLIRRVQFPQRITRLVYPTVALLGALSTVYFLAYVAWNLFGGRSDYDFWFRDSWLGIVYLILLGLVPLLVGRVLVVSRRRARRGPLNHIEILSS
jgi:hypothetical protein